MITLHPCGQKIGEMWVISGFTHILRDPELWQWDLDEADEFWKRKESSQCTLRIAKNAVLLPDEVAHAFSSLLFLSLCFPPAFHLLLPCLSLLLLQLLRDPAGYPVFSPTTYPTRLCLCPAVSGAAFGGVLLVGATGLVPGHSNHLHITHCCWLLVLGISISVILAVPGTVRAQNTGQSALPVLPISCHPKALHRGCACALQVRKCLLCLWWKCLLSKCLKNVGSLKLCLI